MQLTLPSKELLKACEVLGPAYERKPIIPAYENFFIQQKSDGALITATNGQVMAQFRLPGTFSDDYTDIQVPAEKFIKTVAIMSAIPEITFKGKNGVLGVSDGKKAKVAIPFESDPMFPKLDVIDVMPAGVIPGEALKYFAQAASLVAEDDVRTAFQTGKILVNGDITYLESTDARNIIRTKISDRAMTTPILDMPPQFMRMISSLPNSMDAEVFYSDRCIVFRQGDVTLACVRTNARYTDTNQFMQTDPSRYTMVESSDLNDALKVILPYSDKLGKTVTIIMEGDSEMKMVSSDPEMNTSAMYTMRVTGDFKGKVNLPGSSLQKIFPMLSGTVNIQIDKDKIYFVDENSVALLMGLVSR